MNILYISSILLVFLKINMAREIPEYIHVCKKSDPDVAKCIRQSVQLLKPQLKNGIPEINVPPLEPLYIENIMLLKEDDGYNIKVAVQNLNIFGFSNFEIQKLKIDVEKKIYRVDVKFPLLYFDGEFDVDARPLSIPVRVSGEFTANATNCEARCILKGEIIEKNGFRQLAFKSVHLKIACDDYDVQLKSLFKGDPVLVEATRKIANARKKDLISLSIPFIERAASDLILDLANRVTDTLPYDEIFPEE